MTSTVSASGGRGVAGNALRAAVAGAVAVVVAEVPRGRVERRAASPAADEFAGVHAALPVGTQSIMVGVVATLLPRAPSSVRLASVLRASAAVGQGRASDDRTDPLSPHLSFLGAPAFVSLVVLLGGGSSGPEDDYLDQAHDAYPGTSDARLLDAGYQICDNDDELIRHGISVCDTIEELAEYIAQSGVEIDPHNAVIVEVAGRWYSDDEPCDADAGERLILPEQIVSVTDADEAGFFELIDEVFDRLGI